jgi:hypothetical protein
MRRNVFIVASVSILLFALAESLPGVEPAVEDFKLDGPLGSEGAKIERLGKNHLLMTLGSAPEHPDWANSCQFEIVRHARGNALRLEVKFAHEKPQYHFDTYFHSWSYDGRSWHPIQWNSPKWNGKHNQIDFPVFEQDRVLFGLQVPMTTEDAEAMQNRWAAKPCVKLHVLGKSLGGRNLYRMEITDPAGPHPRAKRWVHYFKNEHPGEHNAQWRMVGMIEWLLSEAGADCRRRNICHFVLIMSPDAISKGWYRTNAQGVDMNRSYRAEGADAKSQAHEAYVFQKDLELLMASETPVTTAWQMHTWQAPVEPIVTAGPEIGKELGPPEEFAAIMAKHNPRGLVKPLAFKPSTNLTAWTGGAHKQFGITTVLCEGAGKFLTKEENLESGVVLIKSIADYYRGIRK